MKRQAVLLLTICGLCLLAAGCDGETDDVEVVLSDDDWTPVTSTIELGEELVDNCLGDVGAHPGRGAILERTFRRDLTERVGASLGVEARVAAEVEASLETTLGEELRVSIPSDGSPVPARDSRRFKRFVVQDYRQTSVSLDGDAEPVKVLWAERLVIERVRGTGNLCPPVATPNGLIGKRPEQVVAMLNQVGIEAVPIEFENAWCESVPGRVSAVRMVALAYEELLDEPVLIEPVEGDRPPLRRGDVVEVVFDVRPKDTVICFANYLSNALAIPIEAETRSLQDPG